MKTLDCESTQSMFDSLEQITGIRTDTLLTYFDDLDLEKEYEEHNWSDPPDHFFLRAIKRISDRPSFHFDQTAWFHLTRTLPIHDFSDGILPTNQVIDRLFDYLFALQNTLNRVEWKHFRHSISKSSNQYANLYNLKLSNKSLCGPYAMLIKNVAFCPNEIGNHDYLRIPEIVQDICAVFEDQYGIDLSQQYISSTQPCIVKFVNYDVDEGYLGIVTNYLYHFYKKIPLSYHCNICFDAKGQPVPKESIVKIEFINNHHLDQ